ncbi:unnamed protein product [Lupinus luteus]|uniref:Cupin-like domain-containing protein n=1 Tax=Lupinus luteus TaxID=3873 RepID=A0AAV1X5D8_LUPLU
MRSKHQEGLDPPCLRAQTHGFLGFGIECAYLSLEGVPIMNSDPEERIQLETLREAIQMPPFLAAKELSSINLWMNNALARSSTHYDPYHNLLCIDSVQKQVFFACRFHQVDGDDLTIAINFWWRSNIMSSMLEHMDAYYLCRILKRLFKTVIFNFNLGQDELLLKLGIDHGNDNYSQMLKGMDSKEEKLEERKTLLELEPAAAQVLMTLFLWFTTMLVLTRISNHSQLLSMLMSLEREKKLNVNWRDDPIAKTLWDVESRSLQNVFLAMAFFAQIYYHRSRFYHVFYSAFDDQSAAMNSILKGKESFTQEAFKSVMENFVGLRLESSKPGTDEKPS